MEGPEVHHMSKVMRIKEGEKVVLLDGKGHLAHVQIMAFKKESCRFGLLEFTHGIDKPSALHIAMAPTKQVDRLEWFLEKAVEMGLGKFTPLLTERGERSRLRLDRLERIGISAMKQSLRSHLPILEEAQDIQELIEAADEKMKYIAHCYEGEKRVSMSNSGSTLVLIGPEGDFTLNEVHAAKKSGFQALSLGDARLRTETAAMKAVALFNS